MANHPQALRGLNVFVDGVGFAGSTVECTLPNIVEMTEDYRGGEMTGPTEVTVGYEKPICEFTLSKHDVVPYATRALLGGEANITIRGSLDERGVTKTIIATMQGRITSLDKGTLKPGTITELKYKMICDFYALVVDGVPVESIDVMNGKVSFNGQEILDTVRSALGL